MPKQDGHGAAGLVRATPVVHTAGGSTTPASVVLDTNAVLDWLVFRDPVMAPIGSAIECEQLRWLCCEGMQAECEHVLQREAMQRWSPDAHSVARSWARHAHGAARPVARAGWPRCSDAADQVFIDLAIAQRANWLITRDRALLALARRAAAWGVCVTTPQRWSPAAVPH